MKKIFIFLTCVFVLLTQNLFADDSNEKKSAVSAETIEFLQQHKSELDTLLSLIAAGKADELLGQKQITWADVGYEALETFKVYAADIASYVNDKAPLVMEILIRKKIADAVGDLALPLFLLIASLIAWRILLKTWKVPVCNPENVKLSGETDNLTLNNRKWLRIVFANIIPTGFVFILSFVSASYLISSFKIFVVPEYYAVQDLVLILLGKM